MNFKRLLKNSTKYTFSQVNSSLLQYSPKLWLIGDGRSGTTWITNLLNHDKYYREMFEPYHPLYTKGISTNLIHKYIRPNEKEDFTLKIYKKIFMGKLWNERIDTDNRVYPFYKGLIVKDIFSNLHAKWVVNNIDDINVILLMRNPFAVALSKFKLKHWEWVTNPLSFLADTPLVEDYLSEFTDLINRVSEENDYILNQILIWSIIHYIPFQQFRKDEINVLFYEDVLLNPHNIIGNFDKSFGISRSNLNQNIISKPSKVASENRLKGETSINSWKNEIPPKTIDTGMKILEAFSLENIYSTESTPSELVVNSLFRL